MHFSEVQKREKLHAFMCKRGLEGHKFLGNYLVPMLVECGSMCHAMRVFNRLVDPNEYSWTSLISGCNECEESQQALDLYQKMQERCVHPSKHTFVALLKACARLKDAKRGQEIHAVVAGKGLERDPYIGSTLVDMYAKSGLLAKAQDQFDKLLVHNVVSWNALITGYAQHGLGEEALICFQQMQFEGVSPDAVTFLCSLKACGSIGAIEKGEEIYAEIARKGLERYCLIGNSLVDMYAKCGSLEEARELFGKLPVRDVVSWNALIAGYTQHGLGEEALHCFQQMQLEGVSLGAISFVCGLKACISIGAIDKGQEIHTEVAKKGLERDPFVGSTLVDMYAKFGILSKAQEAFDKLPIRNVVSWTSLIAGYAEHGFGEEALKCFEQMVLHAVSPDALTFVCGLKACGSSGAIDKGRVIHGEIAKKGLERDSFVCNALVDMYAKCGSLSKAQELFDKLPVRDLVSWSALIAGYAELGESEIVFNMLERMRGEGINPDSVTYLSVLTLCSHAGLVDKGQQCFEAMSKDYGITPILGHYTCIIDLLGRAGRLKEASAMLENMPFQPDLAVWLTMLGACRKWGNVELGIQSFERASQLDEEDSAAYVLMSNIYADAHMQEAEKNFKAVSVKEEEWKKLSRIALKFTDLCIPVVENTRHSESKGICAMLEDLPQAGFALCVM